MLSGRDLVGGGIWFGITRQGRFAALTNVREPRPTPPGAPSRGALALDFLLTDATAPAFADAVLARGARYAGFNLLLGDLRAGALVWVSNRAPRWCVVEPGVHALSNAALDTPWPKAVRLGQALREASALAPAQQFAPLHRALADPRRAPPAELPATGVAPELEAALSAAFIRLPDYGTRSSTVLRADARSVWLHERPHGAAAASSGGHYTFDWA
ncbi:hypothetical protein GALL_319580 [mine drainage metagenome]|uniref:NRDE family protein n=1 Tax=mine drainage metagenome TaxID=410659 RepID=A0A1J5R2C9_9ZZZZ